MERKIFEDERVYDIAEQIYARTDVTPSVGLILGSGWGAVCRGLEEPITISYASLQNMPTCGVKGHSGNFVFGKLGCKNVVVAQGRFHLYEGKEFSDVLMPIKVMYALGINTLILTNAAGGLNRAYRRGDLMVLKDHINFTYRNPLIGEKATEEYPVFCDMTNVYDEGIRNIILEECEALGLCAHSGVYIQVLGPSYETPAEIQAFSKLGADAVGMSTVVEAVFAKYLRLKVAAISGITNMGAGIEDERLDHHDVLSQARKNEENYSMLIKRVVKRI